jgi:hypothetical protein
VTPAPTHDFVLWQGNRTNDTQFITRPNVEQCSVPTQHGAHLMRSKLEALWAARFERRGFPQAPTGVAPTVPCYFYEPAGMKKWPTYPSGHHYRIDFILVHEARVGVVKQKSRSCAVRWDWISIKPELDHEDLHHLQHLVLFDSKHNVAFQCCGNPDHPDIYRVVYDYSTEKCLVQHVVQA